MLAEHLTSVHQYERITLALRAASRRTEKIDWARRGLPTSRAGRVPTRLRATPVDVSADYDRCCGSLSAPGRNRTYDTRFRRAVLYPLSYEGPLVPGYLPVPAHNGPGRARSHRLGAAVPPDRLVVTAPEV